MWLQGIGDAGDRPDISGALLHMRATKDLGTLVFVNELKDGAFDSVFVHGVTLALLRKNIRVLQEPLKGRRVFIIPTDVTIEPDAIEEFDRLGVDIMTQEDFEDSLPY